MCSHFTSATTKARRADLSHPAARDSGLGLRMANSDPCPEGGARSRFSRFKRSQGVCHPDVASTINGKLVRPFRAPRRIDPLEALGVAQGWDRSPLRGLAFTPKYVAILMNRRTKTQEQRTKNRCNGQLTTDYGLNGQFQQWLPIAARHLKAQDLGYGGRYVDVPDRALRSGSFRHALP